MVNNRRKNFIASLVALLGILTLAYTSCKRTDGFQGCEGIVCQNAGACKVDTMKPYKAQCHCPIGWEGSACEIVSVNKYLDTWTLHQIISGSDSAMYIGRTATYNVDLVQTGTPTTFFINNFFGDTYYNDIICTIDSVNTYHFIIDTMSDFHMGYDHYHIQWGYGYITPEQDSIHAIMGIRYKNKSTNWEIDTVNFSMGRYKQ